MNATQEKKDLTAALRKFLDAWKKGKYSKMYKATQITWRETYSQQVVRKRLPKKLGGYRVLSTSFVNDVVADVKVRLTIDGESMNVLIRLVKEERPYKASTSGTWGMNPNSIRTA